MWPVLLIDTRYSRGQRTEYNMHLATIGFGHVTTGGEQLRLWNSYLGAHNLPEVVAVGTGLPDALRSRDGATQMVAGALTSNSMGPMPAVAATTPVPQAAGGNSIDVIETEAKRLRDFAYAPANEHPHAPTAPLSTGQLPNPTNPAVTGLDMTKDTGTSPVVSTTAAGTSGSGTVVSGGEAPSTAAFEAAPGYSAAVAPPSTPFAWTSALSGIPEGQLIGQVTDVLTNVAVDYDQDLLLALQYRRNDLRPDAGESNTAAIIRLTVRFLHVAGPRASVREALKHLAQEGWDLEGALGDWQSNQNNGAGADRGAGSQVEDEDGQPPRKKLRVEEDDGCEGEEEDDGKKKSKGKGKEL